MISAKGNTRRILDCYKLFEPAPGISENFDFLSFGKSYANTHFIWYRDPNPGVGAPPRDGGLGRGIKLSKPQRKEDFTENPPGFLGGFFTK